ncbi:hypothetical protein BZA05DRAFT_5950 [Tricharina praecox]|uniref:uncharacterized protein n=1 Tax=Tricharina praecox TaxID=43433 RepID=UPI0022200177|nr:uncharacterized protein BZA05DRAFT_5950 [Tricharina praecox]KAI5858512.1 hypothetical protein BZA05DRAFT_5950 [Tricharina praecox]
MGGFFAFILLFAAQDFFLLFGCGWLLRLGEEEGVFLLSFWLGDTNIEIQALHFYFIFPEEIRILRQLVVLHVLTYARDVLGRVSVLFCFSGSDTSVALPIRTLLALSLFLSPPLLTYFLVGWPAVI